MSDERPTTASLLANEIERRARGDIADGNPLDLTEALTRWAAILRTSVVTRDDYHGEEREQVRLAWNRMCAGLAITGRHPEEVVDHVLARDTASSAPGPRPSAEFPAVDPARDLPAAVELLRADAPSKHPYDALLYGMAADVLEARATTSGDDRGRKLAAIAEALYAERVPLGGHGLSVAYQGAARERSWREARIVLDALALAAPVEMRCNCDGAEVEGHDPYCPRTTPQAAPIGLVAPSPGSARPAETVEHVLGEIDRVTRAPNGHQYWLDGWGWLDDAELAVRIVDALSSVADVETCPTCAARPDNLDDDQQQWRHHHCANDCPGHWVHSDDECVESCEGGEAS